MPKILSTGQQIMASNLSTFTKNALACRARAEAKSRTLNLVTRTDMNLLTVVDLRYSLPPTLRRNIGATVEPHLLVETSNPTNTLQLIVP